MDLAGFRSEVVPLVVAGLGRGRTALTQAAEPVVSLFSRIVIVPKRRFAEHCHHAVILLAIIVGPV